ncbi:MAG: single-stranded DNA-binding protein [Patescibacteria group bacterium]
MAGSLNKVMIIGNLTRDPELKQIPSGQSVCSFGVATSRNWKDAQGNKQEATEFHNVVAWGKLAEICGQYLVKGKKVYVDGRLQTRDWEGQDGVKRYRTEIICENMIMLSGGPGGATGGGAPFSPRAASGENANFPAPTSQDVPGSNPDDEIKVEDIPF